MASEVLLRLWWGGSVEMSTIIAQTLPTLDLLFLRQRVIPFFWSRMATRPISSVGRRFLLQWDKRIADAFLVDVEAVEA